MDIFTTDLAALIADREASSALSGYLNDWAMPVMLTAILCAAVLMLRPTLKWPYALTAFAIAFTVRPDELPLGAVTDALGALFPRLAGQNTATLIVATLMLLTVLVGLRMIPESGRSRDRLALFLTGGAMVVTTVLFHVLIIHGLMMRGFAVEEDRLARAAALSTAELEEACDHFGWACWEQPVGNALPDAGESVSGLLQLRLDRRPESLPDGVQFGVQWSNPDITSGGPYAARYQETTAGTYRLIVSRDGVMPAYNAYEILFNLHMAVAHSIWLFGALLVIYGHRLAFAPRPWRISHAFGLPWRGRLALGGTGKEARQGGSHAAE